MTSTEERVRKLIADNLEVDGQPVDPSLPLSSNLTDAGVSSIDLVAFAKVIQEEFNVNFAVEHCSELQSLADLVQFLDTNTA